jgi:hypothetical protein
MAMKLGWLVLVLVGVGLVPSDGSGSPPPAGTAYDLERARIDSLRQELATAYTQAPDQATRQAVVDAARAAFIEAVGATLVDHWYGTPWDFNGVTETPGEGMIACGYLVSTLLQHAGLQVERIRLAQQASELIILSLTSEDHVQRFSRLPIERFVAAVRAQGPGLYIVGLDLHVGFILHEDDEVDFIHVSFVHPRVVVREPALLSPVLASSQYRVLGKISADDALLRKWLLQERIATRVN